MAEVVDEYEFVEPLPTSYKCPVCRQVQKEAQETDCCFTYFCRQCIEGVINDGKPCPKCDSKKFTASPDTWQQQWIGELKVRCPNRKWGCDRTMELRGVEQHLRECEYTLAECDRGCGQRVRHTSIEQHRETCPKRPSVCEYCKQYKSAHDDVESNHKPKCNYRPIVCPNQCDESRRFPACELNKHRNQCPEQEIECTFTSVGCTAHVKRKNMQRHLAEHLQTASAGFQKLTEKMDDIQRKKQMQALQRSQAESPQGSGDIVTSRMQSDSIAKLQEQVRHMKWKYEYLTEREGTLPQDLSQEVGGSQPPTIPDQLTEGDDVFYTLAGNMVGKWNMTEADLEDLQKTLDLPNQALEKATKAEEVSDKICCMFEEWLKTSPVKTRSHLESCLKPLEKRLHQRAEKEIQANSLHHNRGHQAEKPELFRKDGHNSPSPPPHDLPSHHKHDPAYPGVCFFGDPLREAIDTDGRLIQWPQVGVELDIPPGAVPSDEVLYLSIWPCLSGPYVLPPGWELVSPVYLIKTRLETSAFHLKKPAKLALTHFANLTTDKDCDEMAFVSARFSPQFTNMYHFKILRNQGLFRKGENMGAVSLTHFCGIGVARNEKRGRQQEAEGGPSKRQKAIKYSLLLYHNHPIPAEESGYAVFAVSICHSLYWENMKLYLKEQYPGREFWLTNKHTVDITNNAVEIQPSKFDERWRIDTDKDPPRISLTEVDLPIDHPDLFCPALPDLYPRMPKEHYPPRICLTITSPRAGPAETQCALKVLGVSDTSEFRINLKKSSQSISTNSASGPVGSSASFSGASHSQPSSGISLLMTMAEPTLSELIMVNVCNWYDLGLRLGIDEQSLDEIESSCHGDIRTSKRKMFQAWLKSTPSPSYEKLAQALMEIKECTEANKLCGKYGIPLPSEDTVT